MKPGILQSCSGEVYIQDYTTQNPLLEVENRELEGGEGKTEKIRNLRSIFDTNICFLCVTLINSVFVCPS